MSSPTGMVWEFRSVSLLSARMGLGRYRPGSCEGSEHLLARSANRALPILRKIFETGPLGYFALSVSSIRIIDITAVRCLALPHFFWFCHGLVSFSPLTLQHKTLNEPGIPSPHFSEHVPRRSAHRTNPSEGERLKGRPWSYAVVWVTVFGLVNVSAHLALIFVHGDQASGSGTGT